MNNVSIRPLQLEDCEHIGPLMRAIWLDVYLGIQTEEELLQQSYKVHTPERIAREIDDPNIYSIVVVDNERIVGHARSDRHDGIVEVVRLYLLRAYHGLGIGKAMLQQVDSYFDADCEVWLDVYEQNTHALNFYLSQGYEIMRRDTEVQTEGRDVFEYKMRKVASGRKSDK